MDVLSNTHGSEPSSKSNKKKRDIQQSQDKIYRFLLNIVNEWSPEKVLPEFKRLFIDYESTKINAEAVKELSEIIFNNDEAEFHKTLKRSCYILINNWETYRKYTYITELVELFLEVKVSQKTLSPSLSRLRKWLTNFVNDKDYQEIKIFASRYDDLSKKHWSERYTSYLLVPQYADLNNPLEQREAARALSQQLKERFKFDLAMYVARSQSATAVNNMPKNPTDLGDDVMHIIKTIVAKRRTFSYPSLARIFIKETNKLDYKSFKESLKNYLFFSIENKNTVKILKAKISEKLDSLYEDYHDDIVDDALMLRTCNRVIEYVTTENKQEPSSLFISLISEGSPLNLVVVLLKVILICKNTRTHLEGCIAAVIEYYRQYPEADCEWVIKFMEIFNITFAIYAENVEYNLIRMEKNLSEDHSDEALQAYRVFSQLKFGKS
ncbi:MAG TPA: hypothetical protein V6D12_18390 [Candidatus Obscuribacterales bacterium]